LQLQEQLVAEHPQVVEYKVDLGRFLGAVGILYATQGKTEEALGHLQRARKILREVVDNHPNLAEPQKLLKVVEGLYRGLGGK
jgi:hypothetical protein